MADRDHRADRTDRASQVAAGMSTAAAIAAALAWLTQRKAEAAPPGEFPPELMELLVAIAQSAASVDQNVLEIMQAIASLAISTQGWVPNADYAVATRVVCPAANTPYRLPYIMVPDDMNLVLLGWPLNAGPWVQVGWSPAECTNVNQSYPLLPGATVAYRVKNADCFYVSATAPGDFVVLTVEQRRAV